jgi:peptide/nickel transport system substrate-binding protein
MAWQFIAPLRGILCESCIQDTPASKVGKMRNSIPFFLMIIFFVLLLSLGSKALCASSISVAIEDPPHTMDPQGSSDTSHLSIMANLFDGLMQRTGPSGILNPALAVQYEHPDPLTWVFYLRKGVKFHNGNPFNAEDVKFSLERVSDPRFSEFTTLVKHIASSEVIDDYTVVIKTTQPVPWFINSCYQIFIMDKESTEGEDPGEVMVKPIGTGAYKLDEWVRDSYIRLVANENYWEGNPQIKSVEIRPIKESSTRLDALVSGQVDIVTDVPVELFDKVLENQNLEVVSCPSRQSIFLALANKPGTPMADVRVRKAMYMAINEDEIIEKIMRGHASPAAQVPDPPTIGYNPDLGRLPYNPEMAKQLLKEAGYEKGFEITLSGPGDLFAHDEEIIEAVARYLNKVGIRAKTEVKPRLVLLPEIFQGQLEFYLIGWFDRAFDLGRTYLKLIHTRNREKGLGSLNGTNFSSLSIDAFLEYTLRVVDQENREKLLQDLNKMAMVDKNALIPLHYHHDLYAIQKGRGIRFLPRPDRWLVFKEIFAWQSFVYGH